MLHASLEVDALNLSIDVSENYRSENSQVLYIAPQRSSRARDQSLSHISNGSARRLDGSLDAKSDLSEDDVDQQAILNIIDREIFRWQWNMPVRQAVYSGGLQKLNTIASWKFFHDSRTN
ncbi:hypothetical protein BKA61DRAFT_579797 [Leptodontidium sp. MPI-SDFR-AT-0119]|nr:hypothetical protein BKA61DRAFT_579797 [Leptodontidium sp. MPI-SDFR-AT-0119]